MKNHGTSIGIGLGLLALAVLLTSTTGSNAAASNNRSAMQQAPKVGIVNMKDCFDDKNCARVKNLQKDLNDMKDKIQKELNDMQEEMNKLQSKLKDTPNGSPLFKKFRSELSEIAARRKAREELGKVELQEFWRKARGDVYDEICKAAEMVAKAKGLDLVLKDDAPGANETDEDKQQIPSDMKIVYRAVLYYTGGLDITKDVLAEVNKKN